MGRGTTTGTSTRRGRTRDLLSEMERLERVDAAARAVRKLSPSTSLPRREPRREGTAVLGDNLKQARALESFVADEGLSVSAGFPAERGAPRHLVDREKDRIWTSFGWLTREEFPHYGPDGRRATAVGRLTPEEFRECVRKRIFNNNGGLRVTDPRLRAHKVPNRRGRLSTLDVPATLEQYRERQEERDRAVAKAAVVKAELATRRDVAPDRADPSPTARRYFCDPASLEPRTPEWDEWQGCHYLPDPRLDEEYPPDVADDATEGDRHRDEYDALADAVGEPSEEEEDHACEARYGLRPGTLAADSEAERERRRQEAEIVEAERLAGACRCQARRDALLGLLRVPQRAPR